MEKEFVSNSYNETIDFARKFARTLESGDIVLLDGDLGAGKTVFAKGVVLELSNGKENAVSPTFVIVNEYETKPKLYHFDLYRIEDITELYDIGIEEYLFSDGVCLIEWSSKFENLFPKNSIKITIQKLDENKRKISLSGGRK